MNHDCMAYVYCNTLFNTQFIIRSGAGMVDGNGLPRDGPGFNSQSEQCKNRASRPTQGTVNGGAVSK